MLIHRSHSVYFVLNKSMGSIPLAQLWQTSRAPTFYRWANWETEHFRWGSPEFSCMLFAFDLWFYVYYSQQTNEDKHLHTPSSSCRSVPQCHHTACVACCLPLPWLIFCPYFLVFDPSLPLSGHISWSFLFFYFSPLYLVYYFSPSF